MFKQHYLFYTYIVLHGCVKLYQVYFFCTYIYIVLHNIK
jgi:hypothetical protein